MSDTQQTEQASQRLQTTIKSIIHTYLEKDAPDVDGAIRALAEATNRIAVTWHIEDIRAAWSTVHNIYDEGACPLSDSECMEILETVMHRHDAEIGINWTVLQAYID